MKKTMIFIQKPLAQTVEQFSAAIEQLLSSYSHAAHALRYAIVDADVKTAQPLAMMNSLHPKDAVISIIADITFPLTECISSIVAIADALQIYEVEENQALKYTSPVGRVNGMCQVALLKRPATLSEYDWLEIWQGSHTQIAIATQSTFSYRQNKVLNNASGIEQAYPLYDAIVEEQFPAAAMTNRAVFFNAENNEIQYKANEKAMIDSCMRFVDFNAFECMPMSEYTLK